MIAYPGRDFKGFLAFFAAPGSAALDNPLAPPAGGKQIGPVEDHDEGRRHRAAGHRVQPAHLGDDRVGRRHAHHRVDESQQQRQEEGKQNLHVDGAAAHLLLRAQPGEYPVPGGVVRRLGELLEGKHCR